MRLHVSLTTALLTLGVLAGCDGGGLPGESDGSRGLPPGAVAGAPGYIGVGVQPVPDTPVEALPSHKNHEPIQQSPALPQPELPGPTPNSKDWFVGPNGSDSAEGSEGAPFKTIGKAISQAEAGHVIHVLGGTYDEKLVLGPKAGNKNAHIVIQGEGKPRLTPGSGAGAVVQFTSPYWILDGFEIDVQKQAIYAVTFRGNTQGSVLANSEIHSGALGAGVTTYDNAREVTIENNHIHSFSKGDVDSHGIVIQPTSKQITVRNNDIHDNSGDSVQCIGPEGFSNLPPADGVVIENNHFYDNRENAIDIKTCHDVAIRNNRVHGFRKSSTAKGDAIVIHMSAKNVTVENNDVSDSAKGISVGGNHDGPVPNNIVVQKNRVHDLSTEAGGEGTGIRVENSSGAKILNNTLTDIPGYALVLGHGTGGASTNLTVKNNIVQNAKAVNLGSERPGLKLDQNLYLANSTFTAGSKAITLEGLKSEGFEQASVVGDAGLDRSTFQPGQIVVDRGDDVGLPFCGSRPDLGAIETGC
jgi:nitrous oxidase accessory protein NosD